MTKNGCSIKKHHLNVNSFTDSIPSTVRREINQVIKQTKKSGHEQSLTFCKLNDKIFVSDYASGTENETYVMPCRSEHGNNAIKIGDLHTHPSDDATIGITPSPSDLVSTIEESAHYKVPQIGCITAPDARQIHCMQPKDEVLQNPEKIKSYKNALRHDTSQITKIPIYIRENVANDFHHAWYNRKDFGRIRNPKAKDIIHDAFINSRKILKFDDIPELEKGPFCQIIEDLNLPKHHTVEEECRKVLHVREFLGFQF
jgi:hypothetical protein